MESYGARSCDVGLKAPVRVAVTGAAGNIAYSTLFRLTSGEMLGRDQPIILHLLEIPVALPVLKGVVMELEDCAYSLLKDVIYTDDPLIAFKDVDYALLLGSRPRGRGMERSDLLHENGGIFQTQGRALNEVAKREVKVLVVGNPANTNALIAMKNAPDLDPRVFSSMSRLDHNRAVCQVARRVGANVCDVARMTIWGNHSTTQFPDLSHALVGGQPAGEFIDQDWNVKQFIPSVQKRGAEIMEARGLTSAASAGFAVLDQVHDWMNSTPVGDWVSMSVPTDGSYGIPEGLIFSFPVTTHAGSYEIVQGLEFDEFGAAMLANTRKELEAERDMIKAFL